MNKLIQYWNFAGNTLTEQMEILPVGIVCQMSN